MHLLADAFVAWWDLVSRRYIVLQSSTGIVVYSDVDDEEALARADYEEYDVDAAAEAVLEVFRQVRIHEHLQAEAARARRVADMQLGCATWLDLIEAGKVEDGDA